MLSFNLAAGIKEGKGEQDEIFCKLQLLELELSTFMLTYLHNYNEQVITLWMIYRCTRT